MWSTSIFKQNNNNNQKQNTPKNSKQKTNTKFFWFSNHWQRVPHCDSLCRPHFSQNRCNFLHDNRESIQWLRRCFLSRFSRCAIRYRLQWCDHWISSRLTVNRHAQWSIAMRNNRRESMPQSPVKRVWFLAKLELISWRLLNSVSIFNFQIHFHFFFLENGKQQFLRKIFAKGTKCFFRPKFP